MRTVGSAPVFTLTGRLRAKASFCARHNTVFQGLAADGAKLGLWNLWRAGFRIVNFIHDEVLVEVPAKSNLAHQAGDDPASLGQGHEGRGAGHSRGRGVCGERPLV